MMTEKRDKYAPRNAREVIIQGFFQLFAKFTNMPKFKEAHIVFIGTPRQTEHAIDRIFDRKMDGIAVLGMINELVSKYPHKIIEYCQQEKPELRLNLKSEDYVVGFSLANGVDGVHRLYLRTIIENSPGRYDSRISTFSIGSNDYQEERKLN